MAAGIKSWEIEVIVVPRYNNQKTCDMSESSMTVLEQSYTCNIGFRGVAVKKCVQKQLLFRLKCND